MKSRKMLNNNLLCEVVENNTTQTESGFETANSEQRFKTLIVCVSSEEDIVTGCEILVPVNSGDKHIINEKEYFIVNRREVVYYE